MSTAPIRHALAEVIARSYVPVEHDPDPANHLDTWPDGAGYGEPTEADYRTADAVLASGLVSEARPAGAHELDDLVTTLRRHTSMTGAGFDRTVQRLLEVATA